MADRMAGNVWIDVQVAMDPEANTEIATSKGMGEQMVKEATKAAAIVEATAPVRTGMYRATTSVNRRVERVWGMRRQVAYAVDKAWEMQGGKKRYYAWAVEWGNGAHHTMGNAIKAMREES